MKNVTYKGISLFVDSIDLLILIIGFLWIVINS